MPAEREPHEGTWLRSPHDDSRAEGKMRFEQVWLATAEALHRYESVHIMASDDGRHDHVLKEARCCGFDEGAIGVRVFPTNDVWAWDGRPIFMVKDQRELAGTGRNFNFRGEGFPHGKDTKAPQGIAKMLSVPVFTAPITLEGGGIDVNDAGRMRATRSSIANPNHRESETISDPSSLAARLGVVIVVSLCEKSGLGRCHNTIAVIDADGTGLGRYGKTHVRDDPGSYEKFRFTPSDLGYPVFEIQYGSIGMPICWDPWFLEAAGLEARGEAAEPEQQARVNEGSERRK